MLTDRFAAEVAMQRLSCPKRLIGVALLVATTACANSDLQLIESARQGDATKVRSILRDAKNLRGDSKVAALKFAAAGGHTETVRALLDAGVNVDARNQGDPPALASATLNGHIETMKLLIDAGADPRSIDKEGSPIIHGAVLYTPLIIKRDLATNLKDERKLQEEVTERTFNVVQLLLSAGADVNAKADNGWTPLMAGVAICDPKVLSLLIDAGADVNARAHDGMTALMIAAAAGKIPSVKLLIDRRVDVNATYRTGETALRVAEEKNHPEVVQ